MSPEEKIWNISDCEGWQEIVGQHQVVLCYGHFNMIHPGHIRYLEHAKSLGEQLIVAVQGDQVLINSDNSHHFSAKERALGLAWLHIVDFVLILDKFELTEAIKMFRPSSLVLGKEFEKELQDLIKKPLKVLRDVGGRVVTLAGSGTRIEKTR